MLINNNRITLLSFMVVLAAFTFLMWIPNRIAFLSGGTLVIVLRLVLFISLTVLCLAVRRAYHAAEQAYARLIRTLESLSDGFFSLGSDWKFTYVNGEAERILDKKREDLLGRNIWNIYPEAVGSVYQQNYERALAEQQPIVFETYNPETGAWCALRAHPSPEGVAVYLHYTTEARKIEEALRRSEEQFRSLATASPIGIFQMDAEGKYLYTNARWQSIVGLNPEESLEDGWTKAIHPDDRERVFAEWQRCTQEPSEFLLEFRFMRPDGSTRWVRGRAVAVIAATGETVGYVGTGEDITEQKQAEQQIESAKERLAEANRQLETFNAQLEEQMLRVNEQAVELEAQKAELEDANQRLTALAITDGLTGVNNHRAFQERLAEEYKRTERNYNPFSVILLDVDKFKMYNDSFGHPEGDQVLRQVARSLCRVARETDFVARYGGEEFIVLLPETGNLGAMEAAERFRIAVASQDWPLRQVTASFGVVTLTPTTTSVQQLVEAADKALYVSKAGGRNRVTHADAMLTKQALKE